MIKLTQAVSFGRPLFFVAALFFGLVGKTYAISVSDYDAVPPLLADNATPLVMLALSNDHQLFFKAFTDYDDLDRDGTPDTTYKHSINYVGYYDSYKCYEYDTTNNNFYPAVYSSTKYCALGANQWSGNFLNWASMTRIDEIRRTLFGGYRYNESGLLTKTILERGMLPNDAHSFAKYYNGTDLAFLTPFGDNTTTHADVPTGLPSTGTTATSETGITLCNTTVDDDSTTNNSSTVNSPPLIRVVAGNYQLWNTNERWQCRYSEEKAASNNNNSAITGIYAVSSNPSTSKKAKQKNGTVIGDYIARVEVCNAALIGNEDCKQYPSGIYRPVGILQKFGDAAQVQFGLMSGTYKKNKSGGVLRKDVGPISDEINVGSDGSFKTGGIINTVNLFRIANYDYTDGTYNSLDSCSWAKSSFTDGSCTNWGNPFAEIVLECYRYFAGKQPNAAFDGDDNTIIPGLGRKTTWTAPLNSSNLCAQLNVIAFNASTTSYDSDSLTLFSDLNPASGQTARTVTKTVGDAEGLTGGATAKQYFVGEHGTDVNQACTAKTVTDLGDVRGTCPDAPRLSGTYQLAGMAYQVRNNDIRTDLAEKQTVRTYGVSLAPGVPNVVIPVPGSTTGQVVKILPSCRMKMSDGVEGGCGLVDFKIVKNYVATSTANEYTGSFLVNWEDSEQGGDFDMDMYGIINYTINKTTVTVTTDVAYQSTPYVGAFGFIISGTTSDGFNALSGINSYSGFGCTNCKWDDAQKSKSFTIGASTAKLLEQPLYYATKWGGFIDKDASGTPNLQEEWDSVNNTTGALGGDGIPDTYFSATNPDQLDSQLTNILVAILERTASGTSAAVVTNTGSGEGALYQALYNPRLVGADGVGSVSWVGSLNALFIDRYGYFREDSASPKGQLTDADNIVNVYYNATSKKTQIQRYALGSSGALGAAIGLPEDVQKIKPIWSARDQLGKVTNYTTQRAAYGNNATTGRYILTSIDRDGDGQIGMNASLPETFAFDASLFDPLNGNIYRLLGLDSTTQSKAANLVNFIRGANISGFRNRYLDTDGDGTKEPILLGDIVNASPLAVGRPSFGYDLTYGDETYRDFRQQYSSRRQVVYVGANDGMLHAFNAGFFNSTTSTYDLTANGATSHPLGAELWAYVPYNLLPHLQWLADPVYPHVYYMDGAIKQYDVNIFSDDSVHPGGWGTILVAGMRFGGGEYTFDPNSDADGNATDDITLRSGYVVLDITDPERAPTVLAEITNADMGYTVADPTLVKFREADEVTGSYSTPKTNKWYLVFGSGPAGSTATGRDNALNQATSDKTAKLFVYNLSDKNLSVINTGEASSFVGGIHTADWSKDYIDDAIYYGTVGGTVNSPTGKLMRGVVALTGSNLYMARTQVLDVTNKPFSATPLSVRDRAGEDWVYVGTGRFYVSGDNYSITQQSYFGVKEPQTSGALASTTVLVSKLVNTSDIKVYTNGTIKSKSSPGSAITLPGLTGAATTFNDVYASVQLNSGWTFDFSRTRSRNITQAVVSDQSLVFTEYQPSGLKCQPEGNGFLNAPHLQAGVPGDFAALGTNNDSTNGTGKEVNLSKSLGLGSPSAPGIHQRGDGKKVAIVQNSTGELSSVVVETGTTKGARQSWQELNINW